MTANEVNIIGCKVSNYTLDGLLGAIHEEIRKEKQRPSVMLSANVYGLNLAYTNFWLKEMNNNAELVRNDSAGLQLAGKILNTTIKDRLTWADFGWDLVKYCEKNGLTLFFLGNKQGIAEKAKEKMVEEFPEVKIVGTHHGYFEKEGGENEVVLTKINELKPDILIVGFGMPLQEKWILKNKNRLNTQIIMTGGNCFTFLAGMESRAPEWMHKNGLEWLYRFLKEPIRMFNRYMIGNPLFLFRVFIQKINL